MASPAWIAITVPFRRSNSNAAPVSSAPPNNIADTVPNDPTPVSTPRGGPRNANSKIANPAAPTVPCAIPAANGGLDVARRCQSASVLPAATASVRIQTAMEDRAI
jgi:hypothetical protein